MNVASCTRPLSEWLASGEWVGLVSSTVYVCEFWRAALRAKTTSWPFLHLQARFTEHHTPDSIHPKACALYHPPAFRQGTDRGSGRGTYFICGGQLGLSFTGGGGAFLCFMGPSVFSTNREGRFNRKPLCRKSRSSKDQFHGDVTVDGRTVTFFHLHEF